MKVFCFDNLIKCRNKFVTSVVTAVFFFLLKQVLRKQVQIKNYYFFRSYRSKSFEIFVYYIKDE